jgi:hypothetical protein
VQLPEENGSSEDDHVDSLAALRPRVASPLAGRGKAPPKGMVDRTSSSLDLQEEDEEFDETEDEGSDIAKTESDDPGEWFPASSRPTVIPQNGPLPHLQQAPSPVFEKDVKAERVQARRSKKMSVSELAHDLGGLDLAGEKTRQKAARSTGTRQSRRVPVAEEDEDEDSIIVVQHTKGSDGQKKKKR